MSLGTFQVFELIVLTLVLGSALAILVMIVRSKGDDE